jgi:hypothetical protein
MHKKKPSGLEGFQRKLSFKLFFKWILVGFALGYWFWILKRNLVFLG